MRRILAQVFKELTQVARDRLALALALLLPAFMLLVMGTAISLTVDDMPVVAQNLDGSPASIRLLDAFRASLTFRVVAWPVQTTPERAIATNSARAVLVIPEHFGHDVARGIPTQVQLLVDSADANTARLVTGYAQQVTAAYNAGIASPHGKRAAPAVRAAIRLWFNPGRDSKKFYGPGIFVLALTLFPTLLSALALAKEGEDQTILQVYVSSISAHEYLLGKILSIMAIFACQAFILTILLLAYFGVGFAGDPTPFLLASILYAFCVASVGAFIGASIPNQFAAIVAVAAGGFLFVFMLSGLLFPIENIPAQLRWLSNFVWGRYYIEVVRDAFLQGGGWPATWYKCGVLALLGTFFYGLTWRRMRAMQIRA